ncbi:hypothetical protein OXX79_010781, partial [Metschnikowia pulcherrima]
MMSMENTGVTQILQALEVIYEPKSTNAARREAQVFLESVKASDESPFWGFRLALPENYGTNYIVRHFGLSLLQHAINKKFHTLDRSKILVLRVWISTLAAKTLEDDSYYLKEKLGFLWASLAKRIWGAFLVKAKQETDGINLTKEDTEDGWVSMDAELWSLWNGSAQTRELSLIILRTLFEDIYLLDDPVASKRTNILNQLSVMIITPDSVLEKIYEPSPTLSACKHSKDGWLVEWNKFLVETLTRNDISSPTVQQFVPKILSTFKTCLHWIQPSVLKNENVLNTLMNILTVSDMKLKTLAIDCLHILFTRSYNDAEDFDFFIGSIFTREGIEKLSAFYLSLVIDPDDFDEQAYALLKKTVEMIVSLSEYLQPSSPAKSRINWEKSSVDFYLRLVLDTTKHPSPIISGLSLQMWVTTLRVDELSSKRQVIEILMELLEISADRIIDYSSLDEDILSRKFLDLDFDSTADSASFLANYKKFNEDIVRITVCKKPEEGMEWLERRLEAFFSSTVGNQCITEHRLDEKSDPYNYGVAQFNVIENSIRGVSRWRIWYTGEDFESRNSRLNNLVESLGERLLAMNLASPLLIRKQVQTMVQFAPLLKDVSPLMFK